MAPEEYDEPHANAPFYSFFLAKILFLCGRCGEPFVLATNVLWFCQVIYTSAMSLAGVDAHECIMVGDSLHHDIKGANAPGIASAFITGGIHADELGLGGFGETAGEDAINSLCSKHGSYPSYVLPSFTW